LLFPERNNGCVAAVQQRGQYIHYDNRVEFLIESSIEKHFAREAIGLNRFHAFNLAPSLRNDGRRQRHSSKQVCSGWLNDVDAVEKLAAW
jgi:hypothetical protein